MADFNVIDPSANEILVYDEITQAFINVVPSTIFPANMVTGAVNLSGTGEKVFTDNQSGTLRFKTLNGGNGINVVNQGGYLDISFTGDAQTLGGEPLGSFLLSANNLSEVDPVITRDNISVYSKLESDDLYMVLNGSNIPNLDNTYDLGSNGNRYADVFAVTFHGTATNAITSQTIDRNGANDGDVLTWDNLDGKWVPEAPEPFRISTALDVDVSNLESGSVLVYNANNNRWEASDLSTGGDSTAPITQIENLGSGTAIFRNRAGGVVNFRTLRAGTNVNITTNFSDEEIVITADVPNTTDDLTEGSTNLYYTENRFSSSLGDASINDIGDVTNTTPTAGQGLVWDDVAGEWVYGNVVLDISSTDDLTEGSTNLYFTTARANTAISDYLVSPGISLSQLSNVSATVQNSTFLYNDGSSWVNRSLVLSDVTDISFTNLADKHVIVYSSPLSSYVTQKLPEELIELIETQDSLHFSQASLTTLLGSLTTNDLPESATRKYLTTTSLINELNGISISELQDVDATTISDGEVLAWNAIDAEFQPFDLNAFAPDVNIGMFDLTNVATLEGDMLDNDSLVWQASTQTFVRGKPYSSLALLTDTEIVNPQAGEALLYDGAKFVNVESFPYSSNGGGLQDSQILLYDAVGGTFTNRFIGDLTVFNIGIERLSNVDITIGSLVDGDTLIWDTGLGTFISGPSAASLTLGDLQDVNLNTLEPGQGIFWDGFEFVPIDIPSISIDENGAVVNDVIAFTSNNTFENVQIWDVLAFEDLSALTLSGGEILQYSNVTSVFEAVTFDLNSMADFDYLPSGQVDGANYLLTWNDATGTFSPIDRLAVTTSIFDHSDVADPSTSLADGDILRYNGTSLDFEPVALDLNSLDDFDYTIGNLVDGSDYYIRWDGTNSVFAPVDRTSVSTSVFDNSDVTGTPNDSDILRYNSGATSFETVVLDLNALDDFDYLVGNLTDGNNYLLAWDGVNNLFTPIDRTAVTTSIFDNSDVTGTPNDSDILRYNTSTTSFETVVLDLNALDDFDYLVGNLTDGDDYYIRWDGTNSVFTPIERTAVSTSIFDNSDVTGTPTDNQFLVWDTSSFVLSNTLESPIINTPQISGGTITGAELGGNLVSVDGAATTTINPLDATIHVVTITADSTITINNITVGSNQGYLFKLFVQNTTHLVDFSANATFVTAAPDMNDNNYFEIFTVNGTDWFIAVVDA